MKRNRILDTVQRTAKGLYDINLIDTITMREFESLNFEPIRLLTADDIKRLRLRVKMSQPVFAKVLNVNPSTIKKWESGEKHPSGSALCLLNILDKKGIDIFH